MKFGREIAQCILQSQFLFVGRKNFLASRCMVYVGVVSRHGRQFSRNACTDGRFKLFVGHGK